MYMHIPVSIKSCFKITNPCLHVSSCSTGAKLSYHCRQPGLFSGLVTVKKNNLQEAVQILASLRVVHIVSIKCTKQDQRQLLGWKGGDCLLLHYQDCFLDGSKFSPHNDTRLSSRYLLEDFLDTFTILHNVMKYSIMYTYNQIHTIVNNH